MAPSGRDGRPGCGSRCSRRRASAAARVRCLRTGTHLRFPPEAGREILSLPAGPDRVGLEDRRRRRRLRTIAARLRGTWTSSRRTVRSGWRRSRTARRRWKRLGVDIAWPSGLDKIPRGGRGARPPRELESAREDVLRWLRWNALGAALWTGSSVSSATRRTASCPIPARASARSGSMLPGPDHVDRAWGAVRPQAAGAGQPAAALRHRPPRRHRLPLDPAGGPGRRALGRRLLRAEPRLLRSREHRQAGDRGRAATRSPRPSACSARWPAGTPTRSRSS